MTIKKETLFWLWAGPLCVFASPIGICLAIKFAPDYWAVPFCAMFIMLAGCSYLDMVES